MYYITRRWSGHAYQAETNVPHVARNVWPSGNVSISHELQDLKTAEPYALNQRAVHCFAMRANSVLTHLAIKVRYFHVTPFLQ